MTTDVIGPDLVTTLRRLKLGRLLDTLPDRLALARQQKMAHQDFLLQLASARRFSPTRSDTPPAVADAACSSRVRTACARTGSSGRHQVSMPARSARKAALRASGATA